MKTRSIMSLALSHSNKQSFDFFHHQDGDIRRHYQTKRPHRSASHGRLHRVLSRMVITNPDRIRIELSSPNLGFHATVYPEKEVS